MKVSTIDINQEIWTYEDIENFPMMEKFIK